MEFLLELLRHHGFNQVMVNVSHLANEIEGYFRDGQRFGVELAYSFEGRIVDGKLVGEAQGSAGGMRKIQDFYPFFDDTFVVLCGDALIDLDLTEALRQHREKGSIATIVMQSVPLKQVPSYGVVVTDENGRIKSFQENRRSKKRSALTSIPAFISLNPKFLNIFPQGLNLISVVTYFQN